MENNTSINHENGNDANRLLADSALVCSGCLKKDGTVHKFLGKETHWSALLPMGGIAAP